MAPIKSSLARTVGRLLGISKDTDLSLRGAIQGSRYKDPPFSASGGNHTVTPGNGYKYHTFTSSGSLVVSGTGTAEILMVGGGGGTGPYGDSRAGGGGAGGLIYWNSMPLANDTYPVTVGDGGPAATGSPGNGGNSVFGPGTPVHLVALGGGAAGAGTRGSQTNAESGGSGGGGCGFEGGTNSAPGTQTTDSGIPANSRTYGFGNAGGGENPLNGGRGGGGAGEEGGTDDPGTPAKGQGGDGKQYPAFTGPLINLPGLAPHSGYFAGGGGGNVGGNPGPNAGLGGGGTGQQNGDGTPGVDYTGGGGGGGGSGSPGNGTTGGKGIVVVRYLAPS